MKGARRQSGERTTTENDIAPATEQQDQTTHMSLEEIIARCEVIDNEAAREIAQAAQRLMRANQPQIRNLCPVWGVDRKDEEKKERSVPVLKAELQAKLAKQRAIAIVLPCRRHRNNAAEPTRNKEQAYSPREGHRPRMLF